MREKYEQMTVTELKEVAKELGLKNISGMKKSELVDLVVAAKAKIASLKQEQDIHE